MKRKEEKQDKIKKEENQSQLVTKESICAVCALFSFLSLLILFTRSFMFGDFGLLVCALFTGVFGYMAYPVLAVALYASVMGVIGKRLIRNRKAAAFAAITVISASLIVHAAMTWSIEKEYLSQCFSAGEKFPALTPAGWLGGLLTYALSSVMSKVGAVIIFSVVTAFFAYLTYVAIKNKGGNKEKSVKQAEISVVPVEIPLSTAPVAAAKEEFVPTPVSVAQPTPTQARQPAFNGYMEADVPQRPMVNISDNREQVQTAEQSTPQAPIAQAFSPFGTPQTMQDVPPTQKELYENSRAFLFGATPRENYQRNLIFDPTSNVNKRNTNAPTAQPVVESTGYDSYAEAYQSSVNTQPLEKPAKIFNDFTTPKYDYPAEDIPTPTVEPLTPIEPAPVAEEIRLEESPSYTQSYEEPVAKEGSEYRRHDYMDLFSPSNPNVFGSDDRGRELAEETFSRGESKQTYEEINLREEENFSRARSFEDDALEGRDRLQTLSNEEEFPRPRNFEESVREPRSRLDIFDEEEPENEDPYTLRSSFEEPSRDTSRVFEETRREPIFEQPPVDLDRGRSFIEEEPPVQKPQPVAPQPAPTPAPPKPRIIRPYVKVPLDDFDCRDVEPTANQIEVEETKENILATLNDYKINDATIASVTFGPTVTRYNVAIPRNIPPKKVVALDQPIAISLHSNGVNIYPNYEDGVVSIEVPNKERQFVQLGCMLSGDTFVNSKPSSLMFTMGKDVGNRKVYGDISKMIHMLVAGASGSGKSVFLGSLIISLIYKYSPEELRLILIDPKKTEFVLYNNLPHLMINEIITDANKAVQSLNWAIGEMNHRYELFKQMSLAGKYVVNLDDYNAQLEKDKRLPKIVIIIDELADLMLAAKKDIEDRIQNLTQKARAAGIHLIVATQRPSTDVITGVIKSNLPTRIAFGVATEVDSRVILDQSGAHKLLGKGDFLYTMQGINTPVRVQSAFISSEDSQRVVNFIKSHNEAYFDEEATAFINNSRGADPGSPSGGDEVEMVYIDALRYVIMSGSASISMIQRKCSVGYNKAGKIVEWMEDMGYISSFDGAKARKVLITKEEFESKYGTL